MRFVYKTVQK